METYIINPQSVISFEVEKHSIIRIIDTEGKQVADFIAINKDNVLEKISTKATIDTNGSIFLTEGQTIFSNLYEPLLFLSTTPVPKHDLIFPACSQSMFEKHYNIVSSHPNCRQHFVSTLNEYGVKTVPSPVNFFMNTTVHENGSIKVNTPKTKAGDYLELRALKNLIIAIASCSVSQSKCNGYKCTSLEVQVCQPV